jgi:uncharacterized protein (TIGR02246 family)
VNEIEQMLEAYKSAVRAKDVDAFAALYADDVQVYDMWGEWSYDGLGPWRAMAEGWFGSLGEEQVGFSWDELRTHVSGDVAHAHMFTRYAGLSADGEELRALTNRMTWVLERRDGNWKVVHEHSSSPADFEDGKVKLSR